jgi:hypothetical protein
MLYKVLGALPSRAPQKRARAAALRAVAPRSHAWGAARTNHATATAGGIRPPDPPRGGASAPHRAAASQPAPHALSKDPNGACGPGGGPRARRRRRATGANVAYGNAPCTPPSPGPRGACGNPRNASTARATRPAAKNTALDPARQKQKQAQNLSLFVRAVPALRAARKKPRKNPDTNSRACLPPWTPSCHGGQGRFARVPRSASLRP